ncbi:MAG: beta-galactosidase, partial [Butyrivibrio sp.]|nr:beta-galactosidase [Butyrivibrio sp.]
SYDTKLPYQKKNEYLTGDTLKQMIDECHALGIKVIARCDFSKIPLEIYKEHPEWAHVNKDGEPFNYNGFVQTCINSDYRQKYIYEILGELFEEHDFDGLFCNMSGTMAVDYDYNLLGPCYCDNCRKLYKEEMGLDLPVSDNLRDPAYGKYNAFMGKCNARQKQIMYSKVKEINPAIAVNGFDYNRIESNQDMDRPAWLYQSSANARRLSGPDKDMVVDGASTDFMGFRYRHSSVSPALMEIRQWQNLATAGSISLYIMGTLGNHKDKSGVKASEGVFKFFAEHEEEYRNLKSTAKVLLVDKPLLARVDAETSGFIRVLTENHIPFDEMKLGDITPEILSGKQLVILADTRFISDEAAAMFDEYVENGGTLLMTGQSGCNAANYMPRKEQAFKCLGLGAIKERKCGLRSSVFEITDMDKKTLKFSAEAELGYIVPGEELVICEAADDSGVDTILKLIPEQLYGPPEVCYPKEKSEIPGIYVNNFSAGKAVWVPWLAGSFYYEHGYDNTFRILKDVLINICGAKSIAPDLTPMCEAVVLEDDKKIMIQLINTTGAFLNSFFEPIPIRDVEISLENITGKEVRTLNGGRAEIKEDKVILDVLNNYEAIVINK